jgi:hypothetical protein
METILTGQVGGTQVGDGQAIQLRTTNDGTVVVTDNYFEWTRRKLTYAAVTTSAVQINGIGSATAYPILWNKTSSNVLVVPLILNIAVASELPATAGNYNSSGFCVGYVTRAGDAISATYLSTLTNNTPTPLALGKGACQAQFSATAGIGTAGIGNKLYDLGIATPSQQVVASLPNATTFYNLSYDFKGALVMSPGTAILFAQSATAGATVTYHMSILFAELPVPAGY